MNVEDLAGLLQQGAPYGALAWWLRHVPHDVVLFFRERQALRLAVRLSRAGGDPAQVLTALSRDSRWRRRPPPT